MAKNYPADLYYLMDVSNSMFYDKQNLVHLADSLAETSIIVFNFALYNSNSIPVFAT